MRRSFLTQGHVLGLLSLSFWLSACLPLAAGVPTETPLPSETAPPTATIVWFPATATPTQVVRPTSTATPEMSPGIGRPLLEAGFADAEAWDAVNSPQASVILKGNTLTLAVEPGQAVASLRRDLSFGNFYVQVTARLGLCRGADAYGLLVRATGSSFYRFTLTCSGLIAVERIKTGERLTLLEPTASGDVPLGPPGEVEIGLWAVSGELRLFLNGRYQFSILEKTFPTGALGLFARSNGDTPVTIAFSDLEVFAVDYTAPTRTPQP